MSSDAEEPGPLEPGPHHRDPDQEVETTLDEDDGEDEGEDEDDQDAIETLAKGRGYLIDGPRPAKSWPDYGRRLALFDAGEGPEPEGPCAPEPDYVAWFDPLTRQAEHFSVDTDRGHALRKLLAEQAAPRCAAPGCSKAARPKSKTCSDQCARAVKRVRDNGPTSRAFGTVPRDKAVTRTSRTPSPGRTRTVIADTADTSAPPTRSCRNCGRDISDKRAGAVVCGDACRKAIARRAKRMADRAEPSDLLVEEEVRR